MDHVQTPPVEANDQEWKQRCNKRMEKLKITRIPIRDASSQKGLEQEKLHEEKHIMNFELYKAMDNGNVDRFVDVLEQVFTDTELTLFAIFDQVTPSGDSLLHVAADLGRERIAELIAYHFPGLLFGTNIRRDTALHVAARSKNSNVIKIILSQVEGLTKLTNANGDTPLHVAVCSKHLGSITELLLADSHVVHYLNNSSKSPLYLAAIIGDVEILDLLLQTPFPSNKPLPQSHGNSPLHAAISERNSAILKEILKRKPELIYLRDEDGGTSLHYAAYIGYVEGVRILLNISTLTALERNTKGDLPIHLACKRGHVNVVEELLQQEWPNLRVFLNYAGQNILHVAAKNGKTNVIKYILRNKKIDWFTLNEKDNNGDTPLHLASTNLFVGVLNEIARDKRIDVNLLNNEGLSAHDVVWMHSKFPSTIRESNYLTLTQGVTQSVGQYLALAILSCAGIPRIKKATSTLRPHKNDGIKDRINTLMIVAILIATVTFIAGFTLPGSVYNFNNPDPHKSCMAGLVDKPMFQVFTICNTIAMYSSTLGSFVLLWGQLGDFHLAGSAFIFTLQMVGVAIVTMSMAFMAALRLVASNFSWLANVITIIGSLFLLLIVLLYILLVFPIKIRHPLILRLASLFIEILILFDAGSSDKVVAKDQQNSKSQQVDKSKHQ